jgi:hypothetical protein
MRTTKSLTALVLFILLTLPCTAGALTLPAPGSLIDGIPAAVQYDDFYSYATELLDAFVDEGFLADQGQQFQTVAGVGGQDIVLYTQAGGIDNITIGPGDAFTFEAPSPSVAGNIASFDRWWGQDDRLNDGTADNVGGPVTVGQILTYLQAFDPDNNTPVFVFDTNQTGSTSIFASGQVSLLDPDTKATVESWAFDDIINGIFDIDAKVEAPAGITVTGASGTEYSESWNGSGFADFLLYAPTMNLSLFDQNLLFVVDFHFEGNNNGAEEIFLTGAVAPNDIQPVPEPSTMILLGLGVLGLVGIRYKKKH